MPKYETLENLGIMHKSKTRVVVVSLVERTDDEGKKYKYFNFHEHWKRENSDELFPKKKPIPGQEKLDRFNRPEEVISFTIPYNETTITEMAMILGSISKIEREPSEKKEPF